MGYEIRVVSSEEFDELPYKKARKSLGLADSKSNIAYVRETGIRGLDENTINHEFDELMMKVSPHEEDGIRYKGWWAPVIKAIWAATKVAAVKATQAAAVGAVVGGAKSKIQGGGFWEGAGKGAASGAKWGAIGSLGGSALGGIGGKIGGTTGAVLQKTGSLMGGASPATSPAAGVGSGSLASARGVAGMSAAGRSGLAAAAKEGGMSLAKAGAKSGLKSGLTSVGTGSTSLFNKFGSFVKDTGTQALKQVSVDTALSAFAPAPQQQTLAPGQTPTLAPQYGNPATSGGSAVGGYGGEGALSRFAPSLNKAGIFSPPTQEEYDTGISSIRQAKQNRLSDVFSLDAFRGQNPNENTKFAGAISDVNKGFDQELSSFNTEFDALGPRREYDSVMSANKINLNQMNEYINLAQMDDAAISAKVSNSPEEFRNIFKHLKIRNG